MSSSGNSTGLAGGKRQGLEFRRDLVRFREFQDRLASQASARYLIELVEKRVSTIRVHFWQLKY